MTVAGAAPGPASGPGSGTAPTAPAPGQCGRSGRGPGRRAPLRALLRALVPAGALLAAAAWLALPCPALAAPDPAVDAYPECGGNLTAPRGVIHSPNFPGRFRVPLRCRWVIDASAYTKPLIIVYLTQVYVLNGLNFYAYALYGRSRMGETKVHSVDPSNVTTTHWLSSKYPYLVVDLALDRLEGNHLRVLSHLQDVFGFNLTYEVREEETASPASPCNGTFCCNTLQCSFVGDCFVDAEYKNFWCACPEGHEGPGCGLGPKCRDDPGICRNGGTCSSLGTESIACACLDGYSGAFCEIPPVDEEDRECDSSSGAVCNCTGGPLVVTDRSRYSVEMRLAGPSEPELDPYYRENLNRTFTRNMTEYLENSNVSVVSDLHVTSITPASAGRNLDLKFQVVCGEGDAGAVRAALGRLVDQCPDCLGSLRLAGRPPKVPEPEPMLHLVELRANIKSGVVREGDDFILSCVARGATSMQFSWYKDGVLINASLARRNMLSQVQSLGKESTWSAVLVVEATSPMDAGRFTCRVRDGAGASGSEQCRSVDVRVVSPPRLAVRPLVHTVRAGANVTTCCYTGDERLGVTWAKNHHLLALSPGKEVEEDLVYPPGSLLRLYNVTKSATYTCKVMNAAGSSEAVSRVDVVGGAAVPECPAARAAGVDWPATPVDREARLECTALLGYTGGLARRQCVLRAGPDRHEDELEDERQGLGRDQAAVWEEPDFSECVQEEFAAIRDNFARLTLGYANTTALQTLAAVRRWLEARAEALRPREGEPILALAVDVAAYQRKVLGARQLLQLREELFKIVDLLLQSGPGGPLRSRAVQNNMAIEEVQALVREQALLWASSLPSPLSSASSSVSSSARSAAAPPPADAGGAPPHASPAYSQMDVHVVGANDLDEAGPRQGVPLPDWVGPPGSRLRLHVSKTLAQRSVVAAVVAFKSLHKLLPERSVAKLSDSTELEYELASSLVSVSLGSEAGDIIADVTDGKDFSADVVFLVTVPGDPDDSSSAYLWPRWAVNCAVTDIARGVTTPGRLPWNTSACSTLGEDWDPHDLRPGSFSLRCNCSLPGTMAVLLSSNTSESGVPLGPRPPVALVSGLALCALQAAAATLALLPRWLGRPSCMTFLKLQSAAATAASAGIFLAGLSHAASSGAGPSGPGLVAALHCCLLTALAAHLGKLLLLYTELVGVRPLPHLRQSLLAMVAGAPLVGVLCGLVAARSTLSPARLRAALGAGWAYSPWGWAPWAPWGSRLCSVLVATAAVILVAFGALLCAVVARLATARPAAAKTKAAKALEQDEDDAIVLRRWGLVKRACSIVLCQVCVVALSVAYVSIKSSFVCFAFSAAAAILGAVTLFCYVVKPEDAAASPARQLCGGSAASARTPTDASTDPSQTEPLTSSLLPCLRRCVRASATALHDLCSNARSYQLVPSRPSGPETPTPARLGVESLCPFIVFTKQDAEIESDAAAAEPEAPVVEKDGENLATPNGKHAKLGASPSRSVSACAGAEACTCHAGCYHAPACAPLSPARYVPMCPVAVPMHVPVHVPVMGAPPGSVLGVGKEASLLVPSPHDAADAYPLQDMAQRSPNKYLYMRCRPYRPEDGDEYGQHNGGEAGPGGVRGREEAAAKYARTLYHNDWTAVGPVPVCPAPPPDPPRRPEPVPCYIRGEPGMPVVASPTRRAPPPPRAQVVTCKADVEPVPRPSPPPLPLRAPTTTVTPPEDALDEDVLNKISHDLDYLLSGDASPAPPSGDAPSAIAKSALPQP